MDHCLIPKLMVVILLFKNFTRIFSFKFALFFLRKLVLLVKSVVKLKFIMKTQKPVLLCVKRNIYITFNVLLNFAIRNFNVIVQVCEY